MKTFRFLIAAFAIALSAGFSSCSDEYDDKEIWGKVNELLDRVQKLESMCEQQNSNIAALQSLLDGMKDKAYVSSVTELDNSIGYLIKLSNGEEFTIYNGKDGETPSISVVKEGDNYYWSVNGEILKDEEGNEISATTHASTPVLKTGTQLEEEGVSGDWDKEAIYVSVDNVTWTKIVTGEINQIFTSVEISEDNQTVIITLADGSVVTLPKTEQMQTLLYGTWKSITDDSIRWTFNEDMTFTLSDMVDGETSTYTGTYKFVGDRYISVIYVDSGETWDEVLTIASVTETHLYLVGETTGTFTRVTEEEVAFDKNVILGEWLCYEYDGSGELQREVYTITFKEDGKLEATADFGVADTSWSYTEEGVLTMNILHVANTTYAGTSYSATSNDVMNPTKFTGTHSSYAYNSNFIGSEGPNYPLVLVRK